MRLSHDFYFTDSHFLDLLALKTEIAGLDWAAVENKPCTEYLHWCFLDACYVTGSIDL
jgi:3-methyladenine DNA glycosylase Tag